ncbi:MAG: hypothetical protein ACTSYE_06405 [Alphaproteobacteria bacterium]
MTTFEFSIIASGLDPQADDFEARFYDAGCDDALVSFQKGHIIVDFARAAETIDDAIASAVAGVVAAGAHCDRIEPDPLVSLAEIAARADLTRAAVTQYAKGQRGGGDFPAPVARVTSASPLWNWAHVSRWLYTNRKLSLEMAVQAAVVAEANNAIAVGEVRLSRRLKKRRRDFQKVA